MTDSLERLAATTLMASFTGPDVPGWLHRRVDEGLGGVALYGSNRLRGVEDTAKAVAALRAGVGRHGLLVTLDEEGGAVTRLEAVTGSTVPGNAALGAIDDVAATRQIALALGELLVEVGIDVDLAPCADVNVDAANPVIGVRSFSADPVIVGRHVAAFVDGLQSAGVAACAKHFPGHGATTVDSHLALPQVDAPVEVLRWRELAPFTAAIEAGVASIMTAHLQVPALDPDHPATISHAILTGLLRERMGFGGAIVSDALDMHGIGGPPLIPANVVRSLAAGSDFICIGPDATDELVGACIEAVVGAVGRGALTEERLADAAARVVALMPEASWPYRRQDRASLGFAAAQRALRIEGVPPIPLTGAHVVELRRKPMIAAGDVPWGVAAPLAEVDPASTSEQLDPSEAARGVASIVDVAAAAVRRAEGRGLVVVVRDPQCDPATAAVLAALVAARPEAVVVDMGWPAEVLPAPDQGEVRSARAEGRLVPPTGARITTYGPSRASGNAVARLLVGLDAVLTPPATSLGRTRSAASRQ